MKMIVLICYGKLILSLKLERTSLTRGMTNTIKGERKTDFVEMPFIRIHSLNIYSQSDIVSACYIS